GARARDDAWAHDVVARAQEQLSAPAESDLGRALADIPPEHLGAAARPRRHRRHLHRDLHADGSRRDERRVRVLRRGLRLQGLAALKGAESAARLGEYERDAALY